MGGLQRVFPKAGVNYDNLIRESIERTHQIAHSRIEKFMPDNTVRLPNFVVPAGQTPIEPLSLLVWMGRGLSNWQAKLCREIKRRNEYYQRARIQ